MSSGKVYLVGAGPGDPGLLTLRGRDVLAAADLVLYDGLANPLLLRLTNGKCERTARTRVDSHVIVPQQEINERLVREARSGKHVVRLKGGDPYIFGRGSEEASALEAAGIEYEVIPGVTAATAAGEYAGFSFTHRDIASAVAFVTGHEDPTRDSSRLDFAALAAFPGTLVFYMGLGRIQTICEQLITKGKPDTTPAAVICRASLPNQEVVTSTLAELPTVVAAANLKPPSLIVVGDCVSLRQSRSWFEQRPLIGQRIGITRPAHQCDSIAQKIVELSGQPVIMPLIEINPVDSAQQQTVDRTLQNLSDFHWLIFTSVNGVDAFFRSLRNLGRDARMLGTSKIAAIGSSTAAALEQHSIVADAVPEEFRAEALASELQGQVADKNILWVRANRGRRVLPDALSEAGANVTELAVYQNDDVAKFDDSLATQLKADAIDWVGISSPSIARQLAKVLANHQIDPSAMSAKIVAISPVTAKAARDIGLNVTLQATTHTWDGILEAIVEATNC